MKTLLYTTAALKSLTKLPKPAQADILAKLERYAATGSGSTKALVGRPGVRLRIGDYRAVFIETTDRSRSLRSAIDVTSTPERVQPP